MQGTVGQQSTQNAFVGTNNIGYDESFLCQHCLIEIFMIEVGLLIVNLRNFGYKIK